MKKSNSLFVLFCVLILLVFSGFMSWYLCSSSSLRSKTEDALSSLERNRGRESKQQDEYDKAFQELPLFQAELEEKEKQAEEAQTEAEELKSRRNELRNVKRQLEEVISGTDSLEEVSHE